MSKLSSTDDAAYRGLRPLASEVFPRVCPKCRLSFADLKDFIARSHSIRGATGLIATFDRQQRSAVLLMRNCECGTTIAVFCQDRRKKTDTALQRRVSFGKLMDMLVSSGVSPDEARKQVIEVIQEPAGGANRKPAASA